MKHARLICYILALLGLTSAHVWANQPVLRNNSSAVWFEAWDTLGNATLTIISPEGTRKDIFAERGTPVFYLRDMAPVVDGVYRFTLRAMTDEKVKIRNPQNNGRGDAARDYHFKPYKTSGNFTVSRGVIAKPTDAILEE